MKVGAGGGGGVEVGESYDWLSVSAVVGQEKLGFDTVEDIFIFKSHFLRHRCRNDTI